jgi:hypothetical protein
VIAVTLEGRLGNQLFQYAFAYAAAKRLNTSFYLDKSVENFLVPQYFEVTRDFILPLDDKIFSINGYKNIFRIHAKKAFYQALNKLAFGKRIVEASSTEGAQATLSQLKNYHLYKGFFQSENYFSDYKIEIRALFRIKAEHITAFEQINNKLDRSQKKAVIHIRRSDYIDLNLTLPVTYYKKAIESIAEENMEYIFISDDPSFVESEFAGIANKYVSTHSEIIDLQFLINADVCILSNSSFSWWGAWLNTKENKRILAPKYWLGFNEKKEYPAGVLENTIFTQIPA